MEERIHKLFVAVRKKLGHIAEGQLGLTRVNMALSLLKETHVARIVPDEVIQMGAQTYTRVPEAQWVWCLSLGDCHEFFYGNTIDECLLKAEKKLARWLEV